MLVSLVCGLWLIGQRRIVTLARNMQALYLQALLGAGFLRFARSRHEPTIVFAKSVIGVRLYDGGMYGGNFVLAASGQAIDLGPAYTGCTIL